MVEGDVRDAYVDDLDQRRQHHRDRDDPLARADRADRVPELPSPRSSFLECGRIHELEHLADQDRGDDGHSDPQDVARSSPCERTIFTGRAARPSRSSRGVLRRKEGEGGAGPRHDAVDRSPEFLSLYESTRISTSAPGGSARCPFPCSSPSPTRCPGGRDGQERLAGGNHLPRLHGLPGDVPVHGERTVV